jgi:tripartite-type tricarboxylate transporter receptor subunit TctC
MGVFLPARTPATASFLVNREIGTVMRSTEVREALIEQGFEAAAVTPEAFTKLIREETARWRKVISDAGLKPD